MNVASPELLAIACAQVQPGERLLWVYAPPASELFLRFLPVTVLGVLIVGVLVLWGRKTGHGLDRLRAALVPVFGVIAAGMIVSAPVAGLLQPHGEAYAVTDRRAIYITILPGGTTSFGPADLPPLAAALPDTSTGDVLVHVSRGRDKAGNLTEVNTEFTNVPNAAEV
ncbi:MAG: hypothetical protein KGH84_13570, partial [Paracoccaceae bacterium]|nr:hypothetical protein [Paracoccaceae bacterium]